MAPQIVHLPDGQNFTVQPVYGGLFFKSNELNAHPTPFPAGWTVVLHSEDAPAEPSAHDSATHNGDADEPRSRRSHIHRYNKPTLQNDTLFISSISNPSTSDYKPHASASRQVALMLWITLYWYFQQPVPEPYLETERSKLTPLAAKPRGEWKIRIKREGVFHTKNMIPKLERMGLIACHDTAVGTSVEETAEGWSNMFVTRRAFWQIPTGLFLFTLQPTRPGSASRPGSPIGSPMVSRPTSPVRSETTSISSATAPVLGHQKRLSAENPSSSMYHALPAFPVGPYFSPSRLPTYYPPPPVQYKMTDNVLHPVRQKPPRMGEVFYTRFIPSEGKYLSFRVASMSPKPVHIVGPVGPTTSSETENKDVHSHLLTLSDSALLQRWLSNPRVTAFWGEYHANFLSDGLNSRHSFPAIGMWDGVPFGYFELYWVKEDPLGRLMGGATDFDRGMHVLVGEEWARGKVAAWLSSLLHWCWQADNRTMNVYLEPRVDNDRFLRHLDQTGFAKEKQIAFPHKQSWLCRLRREAWEGPAI